MKKNNTKKLISNFSYDFILNYIWTGWIVALIAYLNNNILLCTFTSALVISLFIFYYFKIRNNKKSSIYKKYDQDKNIYIPKIIEEKNNVTYQYSKIHDTVLSKNTIFIGNVQIKGNIHISGKIHGNIQAKENTVYVLQTGKIKGNIIAKNIIIDGLVKGICTASTVEILKCGKLFGTSQCHTIMIKRGGKFVGIAKEVSKNNKNYYSSHNLLILNPNKKNI
ncbi:putative membrane protein precursor [Wigglesworthia glossinidia endosymbiont of Glossina morsitans morsitans (Yale colony)]|uniref:Putative membrane protein n=1 Tax=Wigglesworthia glossinidia endosymbiont of Glossina morsitans morsitans (Yale colony) TaxID=1142511 RepID=H6Q532_WIGGL|nr:polymer-forming cytoskeletal protein [Wigglesworthia glossinidia]AFA41315.1 putative membrane protein precursor [Wigglesworthia glossinidia endosymbiont of Glossina morsitans morsitans (Yale colony)]